MTRDERDAEQERRTRERVARYTKAGQLTAEVMSALGLTGRPGYMGRGTYANDRRSPGYERSR